MKTLMLLDCDYLCYRAWYAMGQLSHNDLATGVVFGLLRDIISLQDRFMPNAFVFCFDKGNSIRKNYYPAYKSTRRSFRSRDDEQLFGYFKGQVRDLRLSYLPCLGYKNICSQKGYEADDCIAGIVQQFPQHRHIIVSTDHDLYQLLGRHTTMYNPHKQIVTTEDSFSREYGVSPTQWIDVKSIAGCSSDCIEGVWGVGEKTAAKFIAGKLNPDSKAHISIVQGNKIWKRNRKLVALPYPELSKFSISIPNRPDPKKWREFCKALGMFSIMRDCPR